MGDPTVFSGSAPVDDQIDEMLNRFFPINDLGEVAS
jgi:hypothetical protein